MRKTVLLLLFICFFLSCEREKNDQGNFDVPFNPNLPVEVTSIGPEAGGLGTRVVVTGENFGNDTSKVRLFFNEKKALILKLQTNAIYAMVPKQPGEYSTIKVRVIEGTNPDGSEKVRETILQDKQFKYNIKATVTTVAGIFNEDVAKDGPALEATFARPAMCKVDNAGNVLVSDDFAGRIRLLSLQDNKVTTVLSGMNSPWQSSYNENLDKFFVVERETTLRPHLFTALYKKDNWQEPDPFYDQKDISGNYIAGNMRYLGLTADDEYVFILSALGQRLIRVHQESRKVELIGQNLDLDNYSHLAFNKKDRMIYISAESRGRIYRFDPYHTPSGHTTPWITQEDVKHIVGMGSGKAIEGNGKSAQLGEIEGICCDGEGNVYVADYTNHIIWKIDEDLNATIIAGVPGSIGYQDGNPKEAQFNYPYDVSSTSDGILYVADTYNYVIRCIAIQ